MAFNRESNVYTIVYSTILVVVVGTTLAAIAIGLKPRQTANGIVKKKMDILSAIGISSNRKTAEKLYEKHVLDAQSVVINNKGLVQSGGVKAFDVDIRADQKDKTLKASKRNFPLFVAINKKGDTNYIIPVVGTGLWGPIWGYIALNSDKETIDGASFDHAGETPGLGAEINTPIFEDRWLSEKVTPAGFTVVKDGSGAQASKVDGITGGTITSKGVEKMVNAGLTVYMKYLTPNSKQAKL